MYGFLTRAVIEMVLDAMRCLEWILGSGDVQLVGSSTPGEAGERPVRAPQSLGTRMLLTRLELRVLNCNHHGG